MNRRVIAVVAALLVSLLGAVGVVAYARAADSRAVAGQETELVYLTRAEVPMGTSAAKAAADKLIVPERVVAKGIPEGALRTLTAAIGELVATSSIAAGEIVLAARFGTQAAASQSAAVPAGQVAVTMSLPDPQRIAPLLTPGSHIVIYDTYNVRNATAPIASQRSQGRHLTDDESSVRLTRVLLADVLVIAIGATTQAAAGNVDPAADPAAATEGDKAIVALVTVAVTPAQSVVLVHGIQTGDLYAALHGQGTKVDPRAAVDDLTVVGG